MRNPQFVFQQFRTAFAPRKPRNPLLRIVFGLLGLLVLAALLVVGVFVGAAMLLIGLVMRLLGVGAKGPNVASAAAGARASRDEGVIDADYTVVPRQNQSLDAPR